MPNDVLTAARSPVVEIASGKVRGAESGGIHAFKGIPYGAPTGGANRFLPPQPVAAWAGIRDALAYRGQAPQSPAKVKRRSEMDNILGPADGTPEVEDCLTLNIWTPGLGAAKRPVMVWLHGGAFAYGSGNRAVTDGANLARRGDVVVVSVNHRLNICGYLHLADFGGERFGPIGQCRLARHGRGAAMGARQHRRVRRRSRQRHDLRRVRRRRKGQRVAGDAGGEGAVPPRGDPVRRRGALHHPRAGQCAGRGGAEAARAK